MKRLIVILMLLGLFFPGISIARDRDFGIGFILGEPTGISFKKWTGRQTAVDGALAWSFVNEDSLHLHVDYLVHNFDLIEVDRVKLPVYFGLGVRLKAEDKSKFGFRIPVGISYFFEKAPLDIFVELAPLFDLVPETKFSISGGVGIRYYFK